ncbi:hypothetical protein Cgig2_003366 [Carnegiea gigantea]|uniref:Reverse transcriptase domain-containing protein n=1 Tax=Carnegiea gigantea TaxID=171969 RepID=A0A9Q1JWL5_9CARY|nr:hypothetical protein Cgig2_003366 [Carnegiea gigantea]
MQRLELLRPITDVEVKRAMFNTDNDKACGHNGYVSYSFKSTWEINGKDVFHVSATIPTMVPKVHDPIRAANLRPIACYNVVCKCITKVICERLKLVLSSLVDDSLGAFVGRRSIRHNKMIYENLITMYSKKEISPRCIMKVDRKEAYGSIRNEFTKKLLIGYRFLVQLVQKIMSYITIGESHVFHKF